MKTIAYSILLAALASICAIAGDRTISTTEAKGMAPPTSTQCFQDQEFQIDLFGSYSNGQRDYPYADGFGGGIGANYFIMRYLGVGADANVYDGNVHGVWSGSASLIARYPVALNNLCFAPYVFGGGGVRSDGQTSGTGHAGAGVEFRFTPRIGIFTDGRYTWAEDRRDAVTARFGIRFAF